MIIIIYNNNNPIIGRTGFNIVKTICSTGSTMNLTITNEYIFIYRIYSLNTTIKLKLSIT